MWVTLAGATPCNPSLTDVSLTTAALVKDPDAEARAPVRALWHLPISSFHVSLRIITMRLLHARILIYGKPPWVVNSPVSLNARSFTQQFFSLGAKQLVCTGSIPTSTIPTALL